MNISEISPTARSVGYQLALNPGQTYKEGMIGAGLKYRAFMHGLSELTSNGLVEKVKVEGEREYKLYPVLPEVEPKLTMWERCIKADETEDFNEKVTVILAALLVIFPMDTPGKRPGVRQVKRWLRKMDSSAALLYEVLEQAEGVTINEGAINYVETMLVKEAELTPTELAFENKRRKAIAKMQISKADFESSMIAV